MPVSFPGKLVFAHARDIARAHIQAYEHGVRGAYYDLGGEKTTWHDVFCRISDLLQVQRPRKPLPLVGYYLLSGAMLWASYVTRREPLLTPELIYLVNGSEDDVDLQRFERGKQKAASIGYRPAPLDDALRDCHNWLLAQGAL
jgi:nucleoside-diphosphate-sugar epimerase